FAGAWDFPAPPQPPFGKRPSKGAATAAPLRWEAAAPLDPPEKTPPQCPWDGKIPCRAPRQTAENSRWAAGRRRRAQAGEAPGGGGQSGPPGTLHTGQSGEIPARGGLRSPQPAPPAPQGAPPGGW